MGPLQNLLGMVPGLPKEARDAKIEDRDVTRVEAIISSMTQAEREEPALIDGSRRLRIATGSGTTTTEVNNLLRQFKEMQRLMRSSGIVSQPQRRAAKRQKRKSGARGPAPPLPRRRHLRAPESETLPWP